MCLQCISLYIVPVVHVLECSTCQSVWGANHQVSWGRGLGEQEGGGTLKGSAFCGVFLGEPVVVGVYFGVGYGVTLTRFVPINVRTVLMTGASPARSLLWCQKLKLYLVQLGESAEVATTVS